MDMRLVTELAKLPEVRFRHKPVASNDDAINCACRLAARQGIGTFAETQRSSRRKHVFSVDGNARSTVVGALTPCATGSWNRQRSQRGDDVLRRQAMAIVNLDISEGDAPILCNDERRRQR
jgi:hypothetical protein